MSYNAEYLRKMNQLMTHHFALILQQNMRTVQILKKMTPLSNCYIQMHSMNL